MTSMTSQLSFFPRKIRKLYTKRSGYTRLLYRTETNNVSISELCNKEFTKITNNSLLSSTLTLCDNNNQLSQG